MSDADPARRLAHGLVESVTPNAGWDEVRWPAPSRELTSGADSGDGRHGR